MAAFIGLLDTLICDDCITNEQYATVTQIRKCSTALLRLLNNILDLSKVESGKLVLEEAEFDLGRELEGLVDMFSVQCINHNVETVLDIADDMPKLVMGDSARVVQIFANLISNSVKFTSSGHIILRGWCENFNTANYSEKLPLEPKDCGSLVRTKAKQQRIQTKRTFKKANKITVWFEVEDTGCGIDTSKWESVFESFEQADPSTTRTHGGTGLGLCIVRTLVNKMGGEIKIVKKDGPGTVMQLSLVLNTPGDGTGQIDEKMFANSSLMVLLALNGTMGRSIMSKWLRKIGVCSWEVSEWNELTQILQEVFPGSNRISKSGLTKECSTAVILRGDVLDKNKLGSSKIVIVIDIGLLDLSTSIWKEQLKFLDTYHEKAKFAWILNHDTSNAIKTDLRRKGHVVMVNKPLYKAKMVQILETVVQERNFVLQRKGVNALRSSTVEGGDIHECLEVFPLHYDDDAASSDDSDGRNFKSSSSAAVHVERKTVETFTMPYQGLVELSQLSITGKNRTAASSNIEDSLQQRPEVANLRSQYEMINGDVMEQGDVDSRKKSLQGLSILLAEDTPVLQRVATIMLEKMGAVVLVVGDGQQAVEALKCMLNAERALPLQNGEIVAREYPSFHLILMDCQMPRMDGYEATKAIRKLEEGTASHIPIIALTAHAMSSDEAKCLEVGMDAYLTKPIDCKLMMSTILSLTKIVML